jgi:hypothetical protein
MRRVDNKIILRGHAQCDQGCAKLKISFRKFEIRNWLNFRNTKREIRNSKIIIDF